MEMTIKGKHMVHAAFIHYNAGHNISKTDPFDGRPLKPRHPLGNVLFINHNHFYDAA